MRHHLILIGICLAISGKTPAQNEQNFILNIGDPAPPLQLKAWLKGEPIREFQKGKIYVLEFWATWCAPCKAAMPKLSALAQKYNNDVTVLGVDIYEEGKVTVQRLQRFVDSMGNKMDYHAAMEDSNYMAVTWLEATQERGIPKTIVVGRDGRIAWIGHPKDLEAPLDLIVKEKWNLGFARDERNTRRYIDSLAVDASHEFAEFRTDPERKRFKDPRSVLARAQQLVIKEPRLKYTYYIAVNTLSALFETNQNMAQLYAESGMDSAWSKEQFYDALVSAITYYTGEAPLKPELYKSGAEALQLQIDLQPYPELVSRHKYYSKLADWHSRANNKEAAINAMEKAVDALKQKHGVSSSERQKLLTALQRYKSM